MSEAATATPKAKKEPVVETVTMLDGRVVEFPGKRKIQKEAFIAADGAVSVRFDFRNGETRTLTLRPDMLPQYAAHGAGQKVHDECAGVEDIDDAVLAVDNLLDRLNKGEWSLKTGGGEGTSGVSMLLQAICEVTGKSREVIRAFLADKTKEQKDALAASPKFADAVARIKAAKAAKKPKVDVTDLVAGLDSL